MVSSKLGSGSAKALGFNRSALRPRRRNAERALRFLFLLCRGNPCTA
ncbi:hypothetical protein [Azospirillum argentinense]